MITRPCPVCKTGEITARSERAMSKRRCCSRACSLAIAREIRANPPAHVVEARARLAELVTRAAKAAAAAQSRNRGLDLRKIAEDAARLLRRRGSTLSVIDASMRIVRDLEPLDTPR